MKTTTAQATQMNADLKDHFRSLTSLYRNASTKPEAIALDAMQFDNICDIVNQFDALNAVADAAENLCKLNVVGSKPEEITPLLKSLRQTLSTIQTLRSNP